MQPYLTFVAWDIKPAESPYRNSASFIFITLTYWHIIPLSALQNT